MEDGRVLVAGGEFGFYDEQEGGTIPGPPSRRAELFNP